MRHDPGFLLLRTGRLNACCAGLFVTVTGRLNAACTGLPATFPVIVSFLHCWLLHQCATSCGLSLLLGSTTKFLSMFILHFDYHMCASHCLASQLCIQYFESWMEPNWILLNCVQHWCLPTTSRPHNNVEYHHIQYRVLGRNCVCESVLVIVN